eukprot:1946743-Pleurochrysis_carterae.AAC.3
MAHAPDPDDDQTPGLPASSAPEHVDTPDYPLQPSPEYSARARASRFVLLLFAGPFNRPDGIAAFLSQSGLSAECLDSDSACGGGASP